MKKLAVIQIVLGVFVIDSLFAWMQWIRPGYTVHEGDIPGTDQILRTIWINRPNPFVDAWQIIYPLLGLAVIVCGIVQFIRMRRHSSAISSLRLPVIQIVLGVFIIISLVWFIGWAEWDYSPFTVMRGEVAVNSLPLPGWVAGMVSWKIVSFLLGFLIAADGIAQYVEAKELT